MNWQHGYIYMHILSVATTGALTKPYSTNMAKDGHDTANSETFLPQLLVVICCPGQLLTSTHNEETANVNFLQMCERFSSLSSCGMCPHHAMVQLRLRTAYQMRVNCLPSRGQLATVPYKLISRMPYSVSFDGFIETKCGTENYTRDL
jgi:hypothetical protein